MQIRISQDDGTPIDQQVVSQVTFRVSSGRLTAGEQLPTGRKLAEQLLINPNTVAQVCRELESAGVVISGRGSGVSVSDSGSPLSRREKNRILNERIDALLAEAVQVNFDLENVVSLVRQRSLRFRKAEMK